MNNHKWKISGVINGVPKCNISIKHFKYLIHGIKLYGAECENCGSIVFTTLDRIKDNTIHRDWCMDKSCSTQIVINIMEQ